MPLIQIDRGDVRLGLLRDFLGRVWIVRYPHVGMTSPVPARMSAICGPMNPVVLVYDYNGALRLEPERSVGGGRIRQSAHCRVIWSFASQRSSMGLFRDLEGDRL